MFAVWRPWLCTLRVWSRDFPYVVSRFSLAKLTIGATFTQVKAGAPSTVQWSKQFVFTSKNLALVKSGHAGLPNGPTTHMIVFYELSLSPLARWPSASPVAPFLGNERAKLTVPIMGYG